MSSSRHTITVRETVLLIIKGKVRQNFRHFPIFCCLSLNFRRGQRTPVDRIVVDKPLIIFSISPVCFSNVENAVLPQKIRQRIVTGLSCLFLSVNIENCFCLRLNNSHIIPSVRICFRYSLCRLRSSICVVISFNFYVSACIRQNSQILFFSIILGLCIRSCIEQPVCPFLIWFCLKRNGHLFHTIQQAASVRCLYLQKIRGSIQIQCFPAVMILQTVTSCCHTMPICKSGLFIIKSKLCQDFFFSFQSPALTCGQIAFPLDNSSIIRRLIAI